MALIVGVISFCFIYIMEAFEMAKGKRKVFWYSLFISQISIVVAMNVNSYGVSSVLTVLAVIAFVLSVITGLSLLIQTCKGGIKKHVNE